MVFEDLISVDEKKSLQESRPIYTIPSNAVISDYMRFYMYRYFHKDTEEFENMWSSGEQQREQHFYQQFPKKATSLDSEHHYSNFNMYGYCSRWLPAPVVHLLFPFHSLIYDSEGNMMTTTTTTTEKRTRIKRKLTAKAVPTSIECQICDELRGVGVWDRKGNWYCVKPNGVLESEDEMGPKVFRDYNAYRLWRRRLNEKITQLVMGSEGQFRDEEISRLETFKRTDIPVDCIVEH